MSSLVADDLSGFIKQQRYAYETYRVATGNPKNAILGAYEDFDEGRLTAMAP